VVIASRKVENLERVAAELEKSGAECRVVPTDVRQVEACEALIARSVEAFGRLDILVNNSGGSHSQPLESWTPERFQNMIDLNLRSVFALSVAASKPMLAQGKGAIVNVSSGAAELGLPFVAPYGAAKAGVENLTRTFAAAWTPRGVRVNCVRVGAVASEGFVREMTRLGRDPDEVGGSGNAVGRAGLPEEIAYPILFFASDASSFISGETLYAGGGPKLAVSLA
jgi:NAD(P)-dependent dehydrogenase (short-subunit alcohol dehydrogenase family)